MTAPGTITEYKPARLAEFPDAHVLEPAAALEGWTSFVAHDAVRAMAVTAKRDVTWIATWGGVLAWRRGDQYSYRRYSTEHGLGGTPTCVTIDAEDHPWVGHAEGGLSYFDGTRWWPHAELRNEPIRAICAAEDRGVWAAGVRGVYRVRLDGAAQEVAGGHFGCVDTNALLADGDSVLVGSAAGLYRMSAQGGVEQLLAESVEQSSALARSEGAVWIGTPNGVVRWAAGDPVVIRPEHDESRVVGLAPARDGVWVLTPHGIARVRQNTWTTLSPAPEGSPTPRAIVPSPSDDYLWVGTDDLVAGVWTRGHESRWDLRLLPRHAEDSLSNAGRCAVTTAAPPRVWIGTAGGVFVGDSDDSWRFDGDLGDVRRLCVVDSPGDPTTVWMLAWPSGVMRTVASQRLWTRIAIPAGLPTDLVVGIDRSAYVVVGRDLWRVGGRDPVRELPELPEYSRGLAQTADGRWWAGTARGVFYRDGGEWTLGSDVMAIDLLAVVDNVLWAGGPSGLWARSAAGWQHHTLHHVADQCGGAVTAIAPAAGGQSLWVGVAGRVVEYEPATSAVLRAYDRFDAGVCGGAITGLAETTAALWVVSRRGISRLTIKRP